MFKKKNVIIQIICSGSALIDKFGKVENEIVNDGFKINKKINFILENDVIDRTSKEVGIALFEFSNTFKELKPDIIVIMADRYEILAPTIAAAFLNIPIAHIQGGELSGNIDEKVRHAVTKFSNIHFPATKKAKEILLKMGEMEKSIFLTGCPSLDLAKKVIKKKKLSFDIYKEYGGVGSNPNLNNGYIIVMQHPVTDERGKSGFQINQTFKALYKSKVPVIWFWPNVDSGTDLVSSNIRNFREKHNTKNFHFIKNMNPLHFLEFLYFSKGIVGNSSCAIRECSFLGVPAINIGTRQNKREKGPNVIDVEYNTIQIYNNIHTHFNKKIKRSFLYGKGDAGAKIATALSSVKVSFIKHFNNI